MLFFAILPCDFRNFDAIVPFIFLTSIKLFLEKCLFLQKLI